MRFIAVLILSVIMLFQGTALVWITATFYANREYIAKNECVYRAIPENSCQGQCVLMKKLQEEQDSKQGQVEVEIKPVQLFYQLSEVFQPRISDMTQHYLTFIPYRIHFYTASHTGSVFRPPISL